MKQIFFITGKHSDWDQMILIPITIFIYNICRNVWKYKMSKITRSMKKAYANVSTMVIGKVMSYPVSSGATPNGSVCKAALGEKTLDFDRLVVFSSNNFDSSTQTAASVSNPTRGM